MTASELRNPLPTGRSQMEMNLHCIRCGRPMKHATATGMGRVCQRQVERAKEPDPRQLEIWPSRMERLKAMLRRAWWTVSDKLFGVNHE